MTYSPEHNVAGPQNPQGLKIVACIPALNEEKNIGEIIKMVKGYVAEVIVYDDGSTDNTSEVARNAGAEVIRGNNNHGYGAALGVLFHRALEKQADVAITLDSDGQHDPNQIPSVLEPILRKEADLVLGSRFLRSDDSNKVPGYRGLGIKTITKLARSASYAEITDAQSGFRAYNRTALLKLHLSERGMAISTEILMDAKRSNLRLVEVPVTIRYDVGKSSTHNPLIHGSSVIMHLLQFISLKHPMLFYGLPGFALLIGATVFLYYALEIFSETRYVSTNIIIISVGLALIGVVLVATGAIVSTLVILFKGKLREFE